MASEIELKHFSVGTFDNNVYILVDRASGESILFDAPTDARRILAALDGTTLKYILMTHCDSDHVQALAEVHEATGAPVGVDPRETHRLPIKPDFEIHDGDTFAIGNHHVLALSTPGHSEGGTSFVIDDILIAGDTLFPGGPGNTKRPDGDFRQIIDGIRTRLFTLPDNTRVYPGHGTSTTIGAEKPHLQEWIDRGW